MKKLSTFIGWIIVAMGIIFLITAIVKNDSSNKTTSTDVATTTEKELSKEEKRVQDRMKDPNYIKLQELKVKTDLALEDIKFAKNMAKAKRDKLKEDYDNALKEIDTNETNEIKDLETKMEGYRSEELSISSSTKSSLELPPKR